VTTNEEDENSAVRDGRTHALSRPQEFGAKAAAMADRGREINLRTMEDESSAN
jgi:hypothetical protein